MKILSIVIPAYNEDRFIGTLLKKIGEVNLQSLEVSPQIIVVDDCSTDNTAKIVSEYANVDLVRHKKNQGKGKAVRTGLDHATGDFIIIQDADLEYDPNDYLAMLQPLIADLADVVYGSRYLKHPSAGIVKNLCTGKHSEQSLAAYVGGQSLSFVAKYFTGTYISDTVTAYKLFKAPILKNMELETSGFETDHEISCKILATGNRLTEVPISYHPRSREEGKKIGAKDWFKAIATFRKYQNG